MQLSVGVDDYPPESGFAPLLYARRDAINFAQGLFRSASACEHAARSRSMTRAQFLERFSNFVRTAAEDVNFFYFAGHSYVSVDGTHLAFSDTMENVRKMTSVSVNVLLQICSASSGKFVLILDSCRSDTDGAGLDFLPNNCCVMYTTRRGCKRYEEQMIQRSFPSMLEFCLRDQPPRFPMSALCISINERFRSIGSSGSIDCETSSEVWIEQEAYACDRSIFELTEVVTIELITSVTCGMSLDQFRQRHLNFIRELQPRYSCVIDGKPLDYVASNLFILSITCAPHLMTMLVRDLLLGAPSLFSSIALRSRRPLTSLLAHPEVCELPGRGGTERYVSWKGNQYQLKTGLSEEDNIVITPTYANSTFNLDSRLDIVEMITSLKLI